MAFLGVYRAIYDYAPQSEEELEIKEGDLLFVLEKSTEDDWWRAKKKAATDEDDEPEGLIPNNYVEEAKTIGQARAMYDYTKQTNEEISFKEDTRVDVYDTTDPDWTLIGFNGQYGFAPAIYIESVTGASAATEGAAPPMPARPAAPRDDGPIPGEADYVPPSQSSAGPAAALAGVLANRAPMTETAASTKAASRRTLAVPPPMPVRAEYTPEESEEEEPAPSLPQRPVAQAPLPQRPQAEPEPQPQPAAARAPITNGKKRAVEEPYSPGAFRLYNIYEMVSHMGKSKKMPTTLGINIAKGIISITPEQRNDGPSFEWTAEKLTHYSIEGKHIFMELVRPSKSVDFHAGAKDTAKEIVALLGELAGAVRQEGLREVLAASAGTGSGHKSGHMLYEHMALSDDEVTVAAGDEVVILDDKSHEEWWRVRRLRNGKEGVVPSSYVEITGNIDRGESITGLNAARSTVEQNRIEERRLAKEALKQNRKEEAIPERASSLATESKRSATKERSKDQPKSKPDQSKIRTWTDRTGTFKVDAEFIGLRENKIHLHKLNGVKIAVPVSKMAVEDLEYVERATGASLDDDKPLSDIKRRSMIKAGAPNGTTNGASVEKKPEYDWFQFFLDCGVNPQICERYAGAFARDQMGPENMRDINAALLRTLGLKEGDILRVMKHLGAKFDRTADTPATDSKGSLFTGANGALLDNTSRRGRPTPSVQTSDVVSAEALQEATKPKTNGSATPTSSTDKKSGFDDDAWSVQPSRSQQVPTPVIAQPVVVEPPKPRVNEDIAQLSLASPPLQPTIAPAPLPLPAPASTQAPLPELPQHLQGADQAIFNKIAALAPQTIAAPRQRPLPPAQQSSSLIAPPPRAASAPGFPPQQNLMAAPLQPHYTGYQSQNQLAPPGQSLQDLATIQRLQQAGLIPPVLGVQPQRTGMYQPMNGFISQPTGIQAIQQNYPPLQPQPTALQPQPTAFVPTSQFGQAAYGGGPIPVQQQYLNGAATGSPFADSAARPFTPGVPSGLQNSFMPQPTGYNQTSYGFGAQPTQGPAPSLPPQQTGGVFGPSQPIAPLVPQKTGPPPPVRFGVQGGAQPLTAQRTGRAELARATPQNPFGF